MTRAEDAKYSPYTSDGHIRAELQITGPDLTGACVLKCDFEGIVWTFWETHLAAVFCFLVKSALDKIESLVFVFSSKLRNQISTFP